MQYSELPEDLRAFLVEVSAELFTRLLSGIRALFAPTAKQQTLRNALATGAFGTRLSLRLRIPDQCVYHL
ncbi:MAG: hypothetical protein M9930_07745 [Anaerolineae bacterium]|nr:hypothetical protein [Anaerolineae bacterium]